MGAQDHEKLNKYSTSYKCSLRKYFRERRFSSRFLHCAGYLDSWQISNCNHQLTQIMILCHLLIICDKYFVEYIHQFCNVLPFKIYFRVMIFYLRLFKPINFLFMIFLINFLLLLRFFYENT